MIKRGGKCKNKKRKQNNNKKQPKTKPENHQKPKKTTTTTKNNNRGGVGVGGRAVVWPHFYFQKSFVLLSEQVPEIIVMFYFDASLMAF